MGEVGTGSVIRPILYFTVVIFLSWHHFFIFFHTAVDVHNKLKDQCRATDLLLTSAPLMPLAFWMEGVMLRPRHPEPMPASSYNAAADLSATCAPGPCDPESVLEEPLENGGDSPPGISVRGM